MSMNIFPLSAGVSRPDLLRKPQQAKRLNPNPLQRLALAKRWSAFTAAQAENWQRFGSGESAIKQVYQASFKIKDDAALKTPKGQMLKLSQMLKTLLAESDKKLPEQIVLQLCYEENAPAERIRQNLQARAQEARQGGLKMLAARKLLGMPDKMPEMQFEADENDPKLITFTIDATKSTREELLQFAQFLGRGARFLGEQY